MESNQKAGGDGLAGTQKEAALRALMQRTGYQLRQVGIQRGFPEVIKGPFTTFSYNPDFSSVSVIRVDQVQPEAGGREQNLCST